MLTGKFETQFFKKNKKEQAARETSRQPVFHFFWAGFNPDKNRKAMSAAWKNSYS
jgi:hypothetical protein